MTGNGPLRVVIVDDHAQERSHLRRTLETGGIVVAGTRAALAAEPGPVVILAGASSASQVVACDPAAPVLLLVEGDAPLTVDDACPAGACGFVRRTAPARDIVDAIRAAADGRGLRAPATGPIQAEVAQTGSMSSFSATAGEPSAR